MRRTLRILVAAAALVLVVPACGDDGASEDASPQPSSAAGNASTTSVLPTPVLTVSGLGDLELGMTLAAAEETGLVEEFAPSCEPAGPDARGQAIAPLDGFVFSTDGRTVSNIEVRGGAVTEPGGVGPGDNVDDATAILIRVGFTVDLDTSALDVFGIFFLKVLDDGDQAFGATVDPETKELDVISIPQVITCD